MRGRAHRRGSGSGVQLAIPARAVPPLQGAHPGALPVGGAAGRRAGAGLPLAVRHGLHAGRGAVRHAVAGASGPGALRRAAQHRADRCRDPAYPQPAQRRGGRAGGAQPAALPCPVGWGAHRHGVHQRADAAALPGDPRRVRRRGHQVNGRCRAVFGLAAYPVGDVFWHFGRRPPARPTKKTTLHLDHSSASALCWRCFSAIPCLHGTAGFYNVSS